MDVSVIIPSFNRLWCLPKAIESCSQTKCNTEIIVVDDGSEDGTWNWLQSQKNKIKNLIPIYQQNQGQTWAVNKGTSVAKGKYIRFLDSDDFLNKGIIDLQFDAAEKWNADLVYSRVDNYNNESGAITKFTDPIWDDFLTIQLSPDYGSHFLGMLFSRHLVEKVPRRPDFTYRDDRMFLLEVGLQNPKIIHVPGCAGYWVQHGSQMQANYRGMKSVVTNWQHLNIFKKILGELEKKEELTTERAKAAARTLWTLAHWIAFTHLDEACEIIDWIYRLNPNFKPENPGLLGLLFRKFGFRNTEKLLRLRRLFLGIKYN